MGHHNGGSRPPASKGRKRLPSKTINNAEEVCLYVRIKTVLSIIGITIAVVGLGLQIASYINTKVDRSQSHKR